MPVEIRELIIRVVVGENSSSMQKPAPSPSPAQQEELIQECVEQVLKVLADKQER